MFVMYLSNFDSLQRTRAAYYDDRAVRRRVRVAQARAVEPRAAHRRDARRRGRRDARRRRRDARRAGHGGAGDRPADLAARPRPAAAERRLPAPRPLGRSDAAGRGARERDVLRRARLRSRRPRRGDHQRPPPLADDRRRSRCRRSTSTRSVPARSFRTSGNSASSGWAAARWRRRSTWRAASTTCRSRLARGADRRRRRSPGSIGCSSRTAAVARSRGRCRSRRGRSTTS